MDCSELGLEGGNAPPEGCLGADHVGVAVTIEVSRGRISRRGDTSTDWLRAFAADGIGADPVPPVAGALFRIWPGPQVGLPARERQEPSNRA